MEQTYREIKRGERGAWLSIIAYLCLAAIKLVIGSYTNSDALWADGLNNSTDIIASLAVLVGLKISRKPPDHDHRYGHFRAETVAALVASFVMVAVGLQVLYQAVMTFGKPTVEAPGSLAAWTAIVSACIMYGVYRYNLRLATVIRSQALLAAAKDNRSDALVSAGAGIGIFGAWFGWPLLDPITAFIVGLIIVRTGWHIFRDASHALTDGFDAEQLKTIKKTIEETPGVEHIFDLKARIHGSTTLVDATIGVHPAMSVAESHAITEHIEQRIDEIHQITHVHIHIEPFRQPRDKSIPK